MSARYFTDTDNDGKSGYRPAVAQDGRQPCAEFIASFLEIFGAHPKEKTAAAAMHHNYEPIETDRAMQYAQSTGLIVYGHLSGLCWNNENPPAFGLRVRHAWERQWPKFAPMIYLIAAVLVTTIACAVTARGADVPAWAIRGIAAVETGTHWNDIGDVTGQWKKGSTGAVSPWHITVELLSDYGLKHKADRMHADTVLAESFVRLHLSNLYAKTGNWPDAVAAWRKGYGGRFTATAKDYAERAQNYGLAY